MYVYMCLCVYIRVYTYVCVCIYLCVYFCLYWPIGIMVRVFANYPEDRGSVLRRVIPKTQKMVLDAFLLNTQNYKV